MWSLHGFVYDLGVVPIFFRVTQVRESEKLLSTTKSCSMCSLLSLFIIYNFRLCFDDLIEPQIKKMV